jgi:hypothetical protein
MEPRPTSRPVNPSSAPAPETESRPAGVRIFLQPTDTERAGNGHHATTVAASNGSSGRPAKSRSLLFTLLLADVVLCALAWFVVIRSAGAVGWFGWALVALAIGLGAWLSVLAVRARGAERDPDRLNVGD